MSVTSINVKFNDSNIKSEEKGSEDKEKNGQRHSYRVRMSETRIRETGNKKLACRVRMLPKGGTSCTRVW